MPADKLSVVPADLHASADHLDMHQRDITEKHAAANADIEDAALGWVGSSGAALKALIPVLKAQTKGLTDDLADHSYGFRTIGHNYYNMDEDQAEYIMKYGMRLR